MIEKAGAQDACAASYIPAPPVADAAEILHIGGTFTAWLVDKDGLEQRRDTAENTVVTVGTNLILDQALAGSAYTVTGPFMGLISSVSYTAIAAGDTMASLWSDEPKADLRWRGTARPAAVRSPMREAGAVQVLVTPSWC
jgi:hypothetical protein